MDTTSTIPKLANYGHALHDIARLHLKFEEDGLTDTALQRALVDPQFRRQLVNFWNDARTTTLEEATLIMGHHFMGPDQLEQFLLHKPLSVRSRQLFQTVPFSGTTLRMYANTHLLVACGPLSMRDIQRDTVGEDYFAGETALWQAKPMADFWRRRPQAGWQLVSMRSVPNTTMLGYESQLQCLPTDHVVPTASTLMQAAWLFQQLTGSLLFKREMMRTADTTNHGYQIVLGNQTSVNTVVQVTSAAGAYVGLASAVRHLQAA